VRVTPSCESEPAGFSVIVHRDMGVSSSVIVQWYVELESGCWISLVSVDQATVEALRRYSSPMAMLHRRTPQKKADITRIVTVTSSVMWAKAPIPATAMQSTPMTQRHIFTIRRTVILGRLSSVTLRTTIGFPVQTGPSWSGRAVHLGLVALSM